MSIVFRISTLRRSTTLNRQYRRLVKVLDMMSPSSKQQVAVWVRFYLAAITEKDAISSPSKAEALQLDKLWTIRADQAYARIKSAYVAIQIRGAAEWIVLTYCMTTYLAPYACLDNLRRGAVRLMRDVKAVESSNPTANWFTFAGTG
jgi:hypothetical protein